ncbi:MAG: 1,4-dihydroxy-2-naphthoate polyprenyltransferase [Candidatus Omnitrophica bacterium]|nr:1,4-dihydroxy-2-naphthoate polyprenyltransferase [Candidatus Omnitrophota bacterium]MDE2008783.1 1,4-dihydroxy-2-naphthoate polyprenyltransferase [Candidatus Omnitrophota bacterium]MDE2213654.1 1,4-dihydroxy-2-naphthoate polyprenyltransferase [Candidatus Omnitrophota bacterium]MDE2230445.1 1,4-dihydroxy-2-naphthoate polyprenyltransferase [Candidatus Omnitrophota bacterium]
MNPWLLAIRPKTLPAAVAPVIIGTAMAFGDGLFHAPSAFMALSAALCIQIGTNLANDYFDFKKGADTSERQGPVRVTQAGLIKPRVVLTAAIIFFLLAALSSVYLIHRAGFCILVIAVASIVSGIFYTAGPMPLGYLGLGDLFVLVFFGPVAVAGTYYVQSLEINWAVIVAGLAPGFLSAAILAVNNLRDIDGDRRAGKLTMAVRFGRSFAMGEYLFCILAAALIPFAVVLITDDYQGIAVASLTGFLAIPSIIGVFTQADGPALNRVLAQTGCLLLVYSVLFSLGWVLCSS